MYEKPFVLAGEKGTNAFDYASRGEAPQLYVPSVREGSVVDLELGEEIVFEAKDEHGVLQSCTGLKHFLRSEWEGVPVVVVDNHNHVLWFWYEALAQGLVQPGATLIHVDQHKDMRKAPQPLESADLEAVFRYTNEVVNVGNYIRPAMEQGLIGELQLVTSEAALEDRSLVGQPNRIVNIDLDYFAPEMNYIDFEKAKAFIWAHLEGAALVTVATSPFFIDQEEALRVWRWLLTK